MITAYLIDKKNTTQKLIGAFEEEEFGILKQIAEKNNLLNLKSIDFLGDTIFNYHQIQDVKNEINSLTPSEKKDLSFFLEIFDKLPAALHDFQYFIIYGE